MTRLLSGCLQVIGCLDKCEPEVRLRQCWLENQKVILSLATTLGPLAPWEPVS